MAKAFKVNFNVPVVKSSGGELKVVKYDRSQARVGPEGQLVYEPIISEDGFVIYEPVMIAKMVQQILDGAYDHDDKVKREDRILRGKLSRKIAKNINTDVAEYSAAEVTLILDLAARSASTEVLTQLDEIINGIDTTEA